MKILGTGLTGLVGSRIEDLLHTSYEFENISRATGVDITDGNSVLDALQKSDASIVLHLAAKAHVDGCEEDKARDTQILGYTDTKEQAAAFSKEKTAWAINVFGTENLVSACQQTGKKLVYISTDFVFDGEHAPHHGYTEDDTPNPVNWYARTKYEGEKRVMAATIPWMIVRIAYPYRALFAKNDFVRAVLQRLEEQQPVTMVTDHIMAPTFIDDIASALDVLFKQETTGIFHATGTSFLSPYDAAVTIAHTFGKDVSLIGKTTRAAYFRGKAERPFQVPMNSDRIKALGATMKSFPEGLEEVRKQRKQ